MAVSNQLAEVLMGNNLNWLGCVAAVIVMCVSWLTVIELSVSLPMVAMVILAVWVAYHCLKAW